MAFVPFVSSPYDDVSFYSFVYTVVMKFIDRARLALLPFQYRMFFPIRSVNADKKIEKLQRQVEIKDGELKRSKRIQTEQVQELQEAMLERLACSHHSGITGTTSANANSGCACAY